MLHFRPTSLYPCLLLPWEIIIRVFFAWTLSRSGHSLLQRPSTVPPLKALLYCAKTDSSFGQLFPFTIVVARPSTFVDPSGSSVPCMGSSLPFHPRRNFFLDPFLRMMRSVLLSASSAFFTSPFQQPCGFAAPTGRFLIVLHFRYSFFLLLC